MLEFFASFNIRLCLDLDLQDFNAKLSDFGLAKDGPMGDQTHVSTRVMGTYGYAAPEYVMTGKSCGCLLHKSGKHRINAYEIQ